MKPYAFAALAVSMLIANTHVIADEPTGARAPSHQPIWRLAPNPFPFSPISLAPGEKAMLSVFPGTTIRSASNESSASPISLEVDRRGASLTVVAAADKSGSGLIHVTLTGAEGERKVAVPFEVKNLPISKFEYRPAEGKAPSKVALAGAFNGWSQDKDLFERGEDGVFRIAKPIAPGTWTYKLVVDGEWVADPANPVKDESGFGNSVLRVTGTALGELELSYFSGGMNGAGKAGGVFARMVPGDQLEQTKTIVMLDGEAAPGDWWSVSSDGRSILFGDLPNDGTETTVTVVAGSKSGARASLQHLLVGANPPRTPRDEIIYFAFTDRFHDGDPTLNKPAPDNRVMPLANYIGGDWAGIEKKIRDGYFEKLGPTTIWISPPYENTQEVEQESVPPNGFFTSYHGYWPTSSTETNSQFGSMGDLHRMVSAAHENQIAILIDFVVNHVHEDHPLIVEHPQWATDLALPSGKKNIRLFDEEPLTTWFDTFLPSLNYAGNDEVKQFMTENAIFWLKETNADGFRHDAVKHVPEDFWHRLTAALHSEVEVAQQRAVYQVGETISGYDTVSKYAQPGLLNGQFDFPLYFSVRDTLGRGRGKMSDLADSMRQSAVRYPTSSIMSPLIGNHDGPRFMSYADGDIPEGIDERTFKREGGIQVDHPESYAKIRMAFAWLLTQTGAPMLYYGDEIGLTGAADPDNRRAMKWEGWNEEEQKTFDTVAKLNKLRRESIALRRGSIQILHADDERLVYTRSAATETVLVALSRKPADEMTMVLPTWMGKEAKGKLLASSGVAFEADGNQIRIPAESNAWAIWRIAP